MNRKDFVNLLESSASINSDILDQLDLLLQEYPFFQGAHLLLLKGLHETSDPRFGDRLRNSALHIADRELLYQMLYSPKVEEALATSQENASDSGQTVIESANNSEELISSIERESADETVTEEPEQPIPDVLMDAGDSRDEFIPDKDETAGNDELLELDTDQMPASNNGSTADPGPAGQEESPQLSQSDLIDRFIISNPRIEPVREMKSGPVEDRSASQHAEGLFVSETLARIYIAQGYYSKAIDIFEKLSLKYPEKSSYFATQIEKVKELFN